MLLAMAHEAGEEVARLHLEVGKSQGHHAVAEKGGRGSERERNAAGGRRRFEDAVGEIDAELAGVAFEPSRLAGGGNEPPDLAHAPSLGVP